MYLPKNIYEQIQEQCGVDCSILGNATLNSLIRRRMELCSVKNTEDYYSLLKNSPDEFDCFVKGLLVPETWFFRDTTPYTWLKAWLRDQSCHQKKLKILSAPCATGEEAYSLAMCLLDVQWPKEKFSLLAVDLHEDFLKKAQQGEYKINSFRGKQPLDFDKHFETTARGQFAVKNAVKDCVTFKKANLVDPLFLANDAPFDFIFMRNVLIYFSDTARIKTLNNVKRILKPEGLLCLGHADNILSFSDDFESFGEAASFVYRKKKKLLTRQANSPKTRQLKEILKHQQFRKEAKDFKHHNNIKKLSRPDDSNSIKPLNKKPKPSINLTEAYQLAEIGELAQAKEHCQRHLENYPTDLEAYCLLGRVHAAESNLDAAEQHYRKALFLKPDHYEALFQLELLLKSDDRHEEALLLEKRLNKAYKPQ